MNTLTTIPQSYSDRFSEGYKRTSEGLVIMARVAAEVRDEFGYDAYVNWINAKFGLGVSTAKRLLAVHDKLLRSKLDLTIDWKNFAVSAIYLLASSATPDEVRQDFIAQGAQGQVVTHAEVAQAIVERKTQERIAQVAERLHGAAPDVVRVAMEYQVDDPSTIDALKRLYKSRGKPGSNGTFDEIAASGMIQPGDSKEAVPVGGDPIAARDALREISKQHKREERVARICELADTTAELYSLEQRFPLIYLDPPWTYEFTETENRSVTNHYPDMLLEEIKKMPVRELAADDAVMFLWATSPKLAEALELITAWGFTYRTCAVWIKDKIGPGYYFRQRHELLLVATRGDMPTPRESDRPDSVIEAPRRSEHSAKPPEVHDLLESMYPEFAKIELFARSQYNERWAVWGNQLSEISTSTTPIAYNKKTSVSGGMPTLNAGQA